ncbi:NERD domain-containing protein [Naasia lichenicola]|uniref:NERD domain-containing protein n=2 Tax=Naasia lichenicola TaxID=2565933 RepID=A0A4S4FP59_9MICO|nr:NERD domain-containing protein [Naasia lichenicola]
MGVRMVRSVREQGDVIAAPRLSDRPAAYGLIRECLQINDAGAQPSQLASFIGVRPLSRKAHTWYAGVLGELAVAELLLTLGPEWRIFHSVPVGVGENDIDHLLIGPGGVFAMNTKHHRGAKVWVAGPSVLVNGQKVGYVQKAETEARRVSDCLRDSLRSAAVPVTPVVVLVGPRKLTVRTAPREVSFVRDEQLLDWLREQPTVLSAHEIEAIAAGADLYTTWHSRPESLDATLQVTARFDRLRAEVAAADRRWRGTQRAIQIAGMGVVAIAAMGAFAAFFLLV